LGRYWSGPVTELIIELCNQLELGNPPLTPDQQEKRKLARTKHETLFVREHWGPSRSAIRHGMKAYADAMAGRPRKKKKPRP
jgi:hypothetical protein